MDRQRLFAQVKSELEKTCTKKLLQLQEQARRFEDDAAYEAKLAELRYKELQLRYDQLLLEHRQCKSLLSEMSAELERSTSRLQPTLMQRKTIMCPDPADQLLKEMVNGGNIFLGR